MTLDEYQKKAKETVSYSREDDDGMTYTVLGLTNEAGEVAGVLKKFIRGDYAEIESDLWNENWYEHIAKELGDTLWYLAMCAVEFGYSLEEIAQMNLDKLADRAKRGVIKGNGDER